MASLATRFAKDVRVVRSESPLTDDQIRAVAPSIFAEGAHESRSRRYAYIPTCDVLTGLRREGFQPFMVTQARARTDDRREYTKHMLRLRHPDAINGRDEANEIVLINSHDGTTAYQMLAGLLRFVCCNGLVFGDTLADIRVPHKGDVTERVIAGAYEVLDGFTHVMEQRDAMEATPLDHGERVAFARAALALRYDTEAGTAAVTEDQILAPRRSADERSNLWVTFNSVQENMLRGGLPGRSARGRRMQTRPIVGIDQSVKLNRALWVLAEEMRKLRES